MATKREAARLQETIVVIVEAAETDACMSDRHAIKKRVKRDIPCGLFHERRRCVLCSSLKKVEATIANSADWKRVISISVRTFDDTLLAVDCDETHE